ncbi:MAG TPA: ATP-binding cassette domain-containing protein [Mobilitalea sp.]|nr:ATP-binding cassette domain-containing protein [Mobilitalea sp.]
MLKVNNIFKDYKVGKESVPVLKGINMEIKQGEFVAILGPSGCGKTTLLNIIAGIDRYDQGDIQYSNESTKIFKDNDWSYLRKNKIGYIFQNFNLIEHLTALENVELALKFGGVKINSRKKRAKELLEMVGLKDRLNHHPNQLSGGQKQRVAIARALANNPNILLADEPTGAVDSATAKDIMSLLKKINQEKGVTVIMITHDMTLSNEADRKISMLDGILVSDEKINNDNKPASPNNNSQKKIKTKNMTAQSIINIALKNLSNRKRRTALTALGTAIGIIGILFMLGIGSGAKSKILDEVSAFIARNVIYVNIKDKLIDETTRSEIMNMDNVKSIVEYYSFSVAYEYDGIIGSASAESLHPLEDSTHNILIAGSLPSSDDSEEIVIPKNMAKDLVGKDNDYKSIIGKKIILLISLLDSDNLAYQVKREYTISGLSDYNLFGANVINIPYNTAAKIAKESAQDENYSSKSYEVTVIDENKINQTKEQLINMGYVASTDEDDIKKIDTYINMITAVLMIISGVSVVVSAIMITLVMYMSVMEQMRAIGVMRAIGSRKRDINRIFITEGGVIGFFAGVAGVLLASLFGLFVNAILKAAFPEIGFNLYQINIAQIVYCIIFSIFLSIFASFLPARKASKLDPVIALGFYQ